MTNEETIKWVFSGNRLGKPEKCEEDVWQIVRKCWRYKASERPTFEEIVHELNELVKIEKVEEEEKEDAKEKSVDVYDNSEYGINDD